MIGLQMEDRIRSDVPCTGPAVPCSYCEMASQWDRNSAGASKVICSRPRRAVWSPLIKCWRANPWLSFSGNRASLLFFRAIIIGCNSDLLNKCLVSACSCGSNWTECSGRARPLNVVNERCSRIQEDLMRLFVLDNCADVYLPFSSPYLALNWLFESAPRPTREENIFSWFFFFLLLKKHFHFTITGALWLYCQTAVYCMAETVQYCRPSARSSQCYRDSYSNLCIHLPTISGK